MPGDARTASCTPSAASKGLDPETRERLARIWRRAYGARTARDLEALYEEWSDSYDRDHEAIGFIAHRSAALALADQVEDVESCEVLDAGAGTGAAGEALRALGFRRLHALDFSAPMLEKAREKELYESLLEADLGAPLDALRSDRFDAAILVGVYSFGQAPAHSLDELLRVVKPGGHLVLTMRTDFEEQDPQGVAARLRELCETGALERVKRSAPEPYLPRKDAEALFRVHTFRVLDGKRPKAEDAFVEAVRAALTSPGPVKALDHAHIWDAAASRLYDAYIARPEYYLNECEKEILRIHAGAIAERHAFFVELGCGSADKVRCILEAAAEQHADADVCYMPIDVSPLALEQTCASLEALLPGQVKLRPTRGTFDEVLRRIPDTQPKTLLFFGSSIGNIETLDATVAFLRSIRERMTVHDRFIVGFDLVKPVEVLLEAYNAGPENRAFFLHMVRRMNHLLGADFDLDAFELGSTVEREPALEGSETMVVALRVVTTKPQRTRIPTLGVEARLETGDAVQVGISRKFRIDDVGILAKRAGLRVRTVWLDQQQYMALAELVHSDSPVA